MHYSFYASKTDKLDLLAYLFTQTDLRMYDLYSGYGEEVKEYRSAEEVAINFELETSSSFAAAFQLWSPQFGAEPEFIRVELNPKYCEGHTFRYRTSGWGLIQLYFGAQQDDILAASHLGHFNEKGASAQEATGVVATHLVAHWNWTAITATSRKLKYLLHTKWAVAKRSSLGVLLGAAALERQGTCLG
jgi:hypothetical protein